MIEPLEMTGLVAIAAGTGLAAAAAGYMFAASVEDGYRRWKSKRNTKKIIRDLERKSHQPMDREIRTLRWKQNDKWQEATIIIDPNLDEDTPGDGGVVIQGTMNEIVQGIGNDIKDIGGFQNSFVFSRKAVDEMEQHGMSPDILVRRILKSIGKMD